MAAKVAKCDRCKSRLRNRRWNSSVAFTSAGAITALVCPDCLTAEEYIDSEMLAATHEVAVTTNGLIMSRPKVSLSLECDERG
jgi:hypothetical protein